jgi:creatinine amidohydrolase
MRKAAFFAALSLIAWSALPAAAQAPTAPKPPTTREMNLLCWQEFGELVPARIATVLLPMGSLEPHGVIPNGTDNLAPEAMAKAVAERVNALIAPTLNYGMTASMKAFPGTVSIPEETYAPFADGGNSAALNAAAVRVANAAKVRILVVNWWTLADDITKAVFKQNGGHAGNNETAYVQAMVPQHIHTERYKPEMASPNPPAGSYMAVPVTSSIGLYEPGQGYPTFDAAQAKEYFQKVNDCVADLVLDTIKKWDLAGVYR